MMLVAAGHDVVTAEDGFRALSQLGKNYPTWCSPISLACQVLSCIPWCVVVFPKYRPFAMSGAYVGDEVPSGVIGYGFFAKGSQSRNLLRTIQRLLRIAPARSSEPNRECAPAWIPRNGNDCKAMPYVVLTCADCLRAFSMNTMGGTAGEILEIPCRFCHTTNRCIIQPSSH